MLFCREVTLLFPLFTKYESKANSERVRVCARVFYFCGDRPIANKQIFEYRRYTSLRPGTTIPRAVSPAPTTGIHAGEALHSASFSQHLLQTPERDMHVRSELVLH